MGIRKNLKRVLSFLCVVSIVVSSLFIVPEAKAEANAGFERITLSDIGFSGEKTTYTELTTKYAADFFVGKEIVFNASFDAYESYLTFGKGEYWEGVYVRLYSNPNGTDYFSFHYHNGSAITHTDTYSSEEHFGTGANAVFLKREMLFKITTEYYDANEDGTSDGVIANLYLDNKHAAQIKLEGATLTSKRFTFRQTITATDARKDWADIDVENFGVESKEYVSASPAFSISKPLLDDTTLDRTNFEANAIFNDANSFIYYGMTGSESWNGVRISANDAGTGITFLADGQNMTVSPTLASGETLFGKNLKLKVASEIVASDSDGVLNDIKITASVDGSTPQELVLKDYISKFGKYIAVYCRTGATMYLGVGTDVAPSNLTPVTWENFGISEKAYSDAGTTLDKTGVCSTITNIKNTSFRGKLKISTTAPDSTILYYGDNRNGYQNGINFRVQGDGTLKVRGGGKDIAILNPTTAGLQSNTFLNTEFELGIDLWIDNADLKILLYVDGNQYNANAYVWENGASYEYLYNAISLQVGQDSSIEVVYPKEEIDIAPDDLTSITWENFGIPGKIYNYSGSSVIAKIGANNNLTSVKDTSFRGKIKFSSANTSLYYGDKSGNLWGIGFTPQSDGTIKVKGGGIEFAIINPANLQSIAYTSFLNQEFELGIDLWTDNNNLKMILYIDGNQYNTKAYVWENGASYEYLKNGIALVVKDADSNVEVIYPKEEVELAPDNLTAVTWENFGISGKVYSDAGTTLDKTGICSAITNIKNTSFRGKLKISATAPDSTILYYGDNKNGYQNGINFRVQSDGTLKVRGGGKDIAILNPTTAGLQSNTFMNTEFELGIDLWVDNADLKILLYIDGNQYNASAYVWENGASYEYLYNAISLQVGQDSSIEVICPQEEPEVSPDNLTPITWKEFGMTETKNYTKAMGDAAGFTGTQADELSSVLGTSFRGKVKFAKPNSEKSLFICYGATSKWNWDGILIIPQADGTLQLKAAGVVLETIEPGKAGLTGESFINTEFELGVDVWQAEHDVKFNVFINGNQYNTKAYTWENAAADNKIGKACNFLVGADDYVISAILPEPEGETSPKGLTQVTWKDFGMTETKNYTKAMGDAAGFTGTLASELSSLLGTSFRGKVKFVKPNSEKSLFICYGATSKWAWDGLLFVPQSDGTLQVKAAVGGVILATLAPEAVNLNSFLDVEFELGIDIWEVQNDAKVNIFINGVQYKNKTYIWEDAVASSKIGKACNFLVGADGYTISAILPEPKGEASPKGLTPVTWASFGISSGTKYTKKMGDADGFIGNSAAGMDSLLGTTFRGKLIFNKKSTDNSLLVCYGATSKWAWDGLLFIPQSDGRLQVKTAAGGVVLATLEPADVKLKSFLSQEFELGIDIWKSGNDAKVNIFINGVQYRNRTFIWKDAVTSNLIGKACNFRVGKNTDAITVSNVKLDYGPSIKPDKSLKKISFSSFGIEDGVYGENNNALAVSGGYFDPVRGRSLNGTLFSGYVKFGSQNGVQLNYGGKNSAWEGIAIRSMGDALWLVQGDNLLGTFMPDIAGVKLTDNMINLKLSIVFVDSDKDGKKDDVQLGVWFNDRMYKNEYYYLTDFASQMGSLLGIYSPTKGLNIEVKTEEVDNSADLSIFGFGKNWKTFLKTTGKPRAVYTSLDNVGKVNRVASDESPKTSDCSPIGVLSILLAASALAVVIIEKKRYTKKEV